MKHWKLVLALGTVAVILLWALAAGVSVLLGTKLDSAQIPRFGAAGDIFGAASALFAGLGALGVVIVLLVDLGDRREDLTDRKQARRPFVVPEITDQGATLSEAKWSGKHLHIAVSMEFDVKNITEEPALNLSLNSDLKVGTSEAKANLEDLDYPLGSGQSKRVSAMYSATGDAAKKILEGLESGDEVLVPVTVKYSSLSAVEWVSEVIFRVRARRSDLERVKSLLDPTSGVTISQAGAYLAPADEALLLNVETVSGSWKQDTVVLP